MSRIVLFCDHNGYILETHAQELQGWALAPDTSLWKALQVEVSDLDALIKQFPLGHAHTITWPDGQPLTLVMLPLPPTLAPQGGYLVILNSLGIAVPHDRVRSAPSASTLDYTVFNAIFNDARDAILLTDDVFRILAANRMAHSLYAEPEETLEGYSFRRILRPTDEARFMATAKALTSGKSWRGQLTTLGVDGRETPVRLNMRCLGVGGMRLYQCMLRDLRGRMALERDLAQSRMQVADMNIALKQVLRNVEEERQELKDELVQQVREEVLPTVERIVLEDSPLVRQAYRSALEERITDMADTSSDSSSLVSRLTPREMDICRLIQQGWQGRAIAEELSISFETLQSHRKNIRRKIGLLGTGQSLAAFLLQHSPL